MCISDEHQSAMTYSSAGVKNTEDKVAGRLDSAYQPSRVRVTRLLPKPLVSSSAPTGGVGSESAADVFWEASPIWCAALRQERRGG
jgi:hypothetical protein